MVQGPHARRRERHSRAVRPAPDSAPRGCPQPAGTGTGMTGPDTDAEPAGGTTIRSSAGRAGFLFFGVARHDGSAEGIHAARRRGPDLRALARSGRVRARRGRLARRPGGRAVRHHPAATERHGLAAPRPRPAHGGRGPDDPPRPDAAEAGAVPARASTMRRSPPSSCSIGSSPRKGSRARVSGASATSSGCAGSWPRRVRRSSASNGGSVPRPTGAGSGSRWTRSRPRRCGRPSRASTGRGWPTVPRRS